MVDEVLGVVETPAPSEAGSPSLEPLAVEPTIANARHDAPSPVWQQTAAKDGWFKGVLVVTNQELAAWEKTQRGPDGKDLLRGVKLKARLDGVITTRTANITDNIEHGTPLLEATKIACADATGTP